MAFDWINFLRERGIDFVDTGTWVTRGNVGVACPMCGDDHGYHMGISTQGRGWHCWRNPKHSGKDTARLVASLVRCSYAQAQEIVGGPAAVSDDALARVRALLAPDSVPRVDPPPPLDLPKDFRPFIPGKPSARAYLNHLRLKRHFTDDQIWQLTDEYDIRYCVDGQYTGRIMFPVYVDNALMTWTGRTIGSDTIRYKTLSQDPDKAQLDGYPPAVDAINQFLLFHDQLLATTAHTLCLCEGPFDALKINVLCGHLGVFATCFFTQLPTPGQVGWLHELLPRFERKVLILDRGTLGKAMQLCGDLSSHDVVYSVLQGFKDPGEFRTPDDVLRHLDRAPTKNERLPGLV